MIHVLSSCFIYNYNIVSEYLTGLFMNTLNNWVATTTHFNDSLQIDNALYSNLLFKLLGPPCATCLPYLNSFCCHPHTHIINKLSSKIPSFHAQLNKSTRMLFVNIERARSLTRLHSTLMSIENLFYFFLLFAPFPFQICSPRPLCYLPLDLHCAKIVFTYTLCWCVCVCVVNAMLLLLLLAASHKSR